MQGKLAAHYSIISTWLLWWHNCYESQFLQSITKMFKVRNHTKSAALISKSTLSTISYAHFQVDAAVLICFTASYQCNEFPSCLVVICLEFPDCTGLSCLHLRQMLRGQTEKLLMNVLSHVLFGPGTQWGAHCAEIDWMTDVCLVAFFTSGALKSDGFIWCMLFMHPTLAVTVRTWIHGAQNNFFYAKWKHKT